MYEYSYHLGSLKPSSKFRGVQICCQMSFVDFGIVGEGRWTGPAMVENLEKYNDNQMM